MPLFGILHRMILHWLFIIDNVYTVIYLFILLCYLLGLKRHVIHTVGHSCFICYTLAKHFNQQWLDDGSALKDKYFVLLFFIIVVITCIISKNCIYIYSLSALMKSMTYFTYVTLLHLMSVMYCYDNNPGITSESMRRVGVIISIDKVQTRNIRKIRHRPHERG